MSIDNNDINSYKPNIEGREHDANAAWKDIKYLMEHENELRIFLGKAIEISKEEKENLGDKFILAVKRYSNVDLVKIIVREKSGVEYTDETIEKAINLNPKHKATQGLSITEMIRDIIGELLEMEKSIKQEDENLVPEMPEDLRDYHNSIQPQQGKLDDNSKLTKTQKAGKKWRENLQGRKTGIERSAGDN